MKKYNAGYVTLGMLVHWAWRGGHPAVTPWSHAYALHLAIARVVRHPLLVHGFHGLIKKTQNNQQIYLIGLIYCLLSGVKILMKAGKEKD